MKYRILLNGQIYKEYSFNNDEEAKKHLIIVSISNLDKKAELWLDNRIIDCRDAVKGLQVNEKNGGKMNNKYDYELLELDDNKIQVFVDAELFSEKVIEITEALGGLIDKQNYHSKYNNYVVYDHAPFVISGYDYKATLIFKDKNMRAFAMHELENKFRTIITLEKLLTEVK